jgi:hypothetical protein
VFDHYKRRKLEKRRTKTLSAIRGERLAFESMVQRARIAGESLDGTLLTSVDERLREIQERASRETNLDELEELVGDAEQQGHLRAYICPSAEIRNEGTLAIDLMEEWNVPKSRLDKLRRLVDTQLQNAATAPDAGRSALRDILEESDSWSGYTSQYEDEMRRFTRWWLFLPTVVMLIAAIYALRFPLIFPLGVPILLAGAAGSCASVMAKMPVLEVGLSGELESYERRILSRIAAGVAGSLIGCGLLGWGLVSLSVQGRSFAEVLEACSVPSAAARTGVQSLVLLAVPMVFGFSERALASFELRVLQKSGQK